MKYDALTPPVQCIMTNSTCYCSTHRMSIKGIIIHSKPGKKIKNFVQPSPKDPNKEQLLNLIGKNKNFTDLNHTPHYYGVHAWVGELDDGTIGSIQTLPWDWRAWGCGMGEKGTCDNGWIQITICQNEFRKEELKKELIELISYLCNLFQLNPFNYIFSESYKRVPVIALHNNLYCLRTDIWLNNFPFKDFYRDISLNTYGRIVSGNHIYLSDYDSKFKVLVDNLEVYSGPGKQYFKNRKLKKEEIVRIVEQKNGFGKLKHHQEGWIDLFYTKEVN